MTVAAHRCRVPDDHLDKENTSRGGAVVSGPKQRRFTLPRRRWCTLPLLTHGDAEKTEPRVESTPLYAATDRPRPSSAIIWIAGSTEGVPCCRYWPREAGRGRRRAASVATIGAQRPTSLQRLLSANLRFSGRLQAAKVVHQAGRPRKRPSTAAGEHGGGHRSGHVCYLGVALDLLLPGVRRSVGKI